ncbi:GrlR family regulatory protein [Tardiphaga sp. vice278]|uniref:GrlR family regulatory protein n=1 Tax=Tardiphaga sp. vice278 TaxID=2592815 RepID=UPI0011625A23|nr:GrlR family regulatory protein [Tardiphaga sp. vice278]QDM15921.1 hypothetical protein FNL53_08400 [Tardiphaga sp. vice278]
MFDGFYKSEFSINDAVGRSVTHVRGGKLLGGNSAFSHTGSYVEDDGEIILEVTSRLHTSDPKYPSLLGSDVSMIHVRGRADGRNYRFEGTSPQVPGAMFRSLMTPLGDDDMPPAGKVGDGGIGDGLYAVQFRMLDGLKDGLNGVMLLKDGRILGGDAFFYYVGAYASADGRWKGEIINQEHTPASSEHLLFSGHEVGIGFAGTCNVEGAELERTALAGKRSLRLRASLKLVCKA